MVVLLEKQRTCNSQVAGSSLAAHHCIVALGKLPTPVVYASVTKQYNSVAAKGVDLFG